jgi:hypothetical protein
MRALGLRLNIPHGHVFRACSSPNIGNENWIGQIVFEYYDASWCGWFTLITTIFKGKFNLYIHVLSSLTDVGDTSLQLHVHEYYFVDMQVS